MYIVYLLYRYDAYYDAYYNQSRHFIFLLCSLYLSLSPSPFSLSFSSLYLSLFLLSLSLSPSPFSLSFSSLYFSLSFAVFASLTLTLLLFWHFINIFFLNCTPIVSTIQVYISIKYTLWLVFNTKFEIHVMLHSTYYTSHKNNCQKM